MAFYRISDTTLTEIADALRSRLGSNAKFSPAEMADAIGLISGDGGGMEISFLLDDKTTTVALPDVTTLLVNESAVLQVLLNGVAIWGDKNYGITNLLPQATTELNGEEIYGDVGYKDGYRWSSSSNAETAYALNSGRSGRLSGWIPCSYGDVIRVKGFYDEARQSLGGYLAGIYVVVANTDGTIKPLTALSKTTTADWFTYDSDANLYTIFCNNTNFTNMTHFRISGFNDEDDPIITINEEIQ